jgi:hypothetical protein
MNMKSILAAGVAVLAGLGVLTSLAPQAEAVNRFGWSKSKETLYIHGKIEVGDAEKIADMINSSRRNLRGIILNSPGGNPYEAVKLIDLIKNRDFDTGVTKGGMCASACFMLWAAGRNKYVYADSQIGIHSASYLNNQTGQTEENQFAMATTLGMARVYNALDVPVGLIGRMVITPPDNVYWLDNNDLAAMNVRVMQ